MSDIGIEGIKAIESPYYELFGVGFTCDVNIWGISHDEITRIFDSINQTSKLPATLEHKPLGFHTGDTLSPSDILGKAICPRERLAVLQKLVTPLNKTIEGLAELAVVEGAQLNSTLEDCLGNFFKLFYLEVYKKIPIEVEKNHNSVVQNYGLTHTHTLKNLLDENSQLVPAIFLAILDKIDIEIKAKDIENTTAIDILLGINPKELMVLFNKLAIGFNGSLAPGSERIGQLIDFKFNVYGLPELSINESQHERNQEITRNYNQNRKNALKFLLELEKEIKKAGGELLVTQDRLYHWLGNTGVCPVILGDNLGTSEVYLQQILLCLRVIEHWYSPRKRDFEP